MRQFLSQYGYQIFGLISMIGGPLVGLYIKRKGVGIDLEAKKETAAIDVQILPIELLKEELRITRGELAEVRADDRKERDEYLKTLAGIQATMEKMAASLDRQEMRHDQHAQRVESRLDDVDNRLLVIETRQQSANG